MRVVVGMLACLGVGTLTLALADPPASTPAATSTPAASSTPAATSTPAAQPTKSTSVKDEFTPEENHFVQEGYHLETHRGTRVFCRYEVQTESRVERQKICGTVDQLKSAENQSQRAFGPGQTTSSSR